MILLNSLVQHYSVNDLCGKKHDRFMIRAAKKHDWCAIRTAKNTSAPLVRKNEFLMCPSCALHVAITIFLCILGALHNGFQWALHPWCSKNEFSVCPLCILHAVIMFFYVHLGALHIIYLYILDAALPIFSAPSVCCQCDNCEDDDHHSQEFCQFLTKYLKNLYLIICIVTSLTTS